MCSNRNNGKFFYYIKTLFHKFLIYFFLPKNSVTPKIPFCLIKLFSIGQFMKPLILPSLHKLCAKFRQFTTYFEASFFETLKQSLNFK